MLKNKKPMIHERGMSFPVLIFEITIAKDLESLTKLCSSVAISKRCSNSNLYRCNSHWLPTNTRNAINERIYQPE